MEGLSSTSLLWLYAFTVYHIYLLIFNLPLVTVTVTVRKYFPLWDMSDQMRRLRQKRRQSDRYFHGSSQRGNGIHERDRGEKSNFTERSRRNGGDDNGLEGSRKRKRAETKQDDDGGEEDTPERLGVIPGITLDDMGGLAREIPIIKELIELPIRSPHLFSRLGADPPCGVLLHGPPGCGKTKLVHAISGSLQVPLFFVSAPEIVSGISGDSEAKLRNLFLDAISAAPSIVFIDEVDTIAGRRDQAQRGMESRIVGQLLTCMDQVAQAWRQHNKVVCVMGATNRPEALDTALRRAGRFDREISLGIPTIDERHSILKIICQKLHLAEDVDFFELANMTPGYVGADLHLLVKEACILAIRQKHNELEEKNKLDDPNAEELVSFVVTRDNMKEAVKRVQPSAMREGFTTIPNVTWDDIGALEDVREELITSILQPIRSPKLHRRFGLDHPVGVLLYGPPGCGKTLVAKAIANQSGANFISIKGPELLNKFVGESERSVRMVFARGRASAPCVLFFDELDALAPRRGSDRANPSSERVVNQLLTEMDGVEGRESVYVIGATNRPDMIDPAMLRPGRLDKMLYVPLPSVEQRASILETHARRYPIDASVDLPSIARDERLQGFSGADLAALMREASLHALKNIYRGATEEMLEQMERDASGEAVANAQLPSVTMEDFEVSMSKVKPSVSAKDRMDYEILHKQLARDAKGPC
ncbi:vesicular transport protein (CDC48 homologue), putative [Trypanosoma brucei brucei TREU927]|uniref:Vesicular transport protein (CDC48 homologue), putative n=2 Tax=Trypanozoon TaxID=39700 RepID=Q386Y8_TRYB2|nr:vesicular transport protein [Trypanosoma brucei brucei TREU927]EAN79143.1 vesicular transport protein (CDC48 homologue), putative [Trypanosoma brucei brucei TREU927]